LDALYEVMRCDEDGDRAAEAEEQEPEAWAALRQKLDSRAR
jgi:hypothetical protein